MIEPIERMRKLVNDNLVMGLRFQMNRELNELEREIEQKLNSRAERTCKQEERGWGTEGDHARVWLTCGHDCMVPTVQDLPNYCPNCGAKVLRNTPKDSETGAKVVGE